MRLSPWQTLQSKITKKAGGLATLMCLALACSLVGYFYAHPIGLITSDLGRHISNGAVILAHGEPIRTNFYSYTQPTFSAVTHHWLAGVVYFWIWKLWGFSGLSVVNIGIGVLITGLVVMPSIKSSSRWTTLILSGLMIPLLTSRTEVRPEQWSYLFLVTQVDQGIELLFRFWIRRHYPDHKVIGEEFEQDVIEPGDMVWYIDPIDGTANFVSGDPNVCLMVGGVRSGVPIFGYLNLFNFNTRYLAYEGSSTVFKRVGQQDSTIQIRLSPSLTIGVEYMPESDKEELIFDEVFDSIYSPAPQLKSIGCNLVQIIEGRYSSFYKPIVKLWDIIPGLCILRLGSSQFDYSMLYPIYDETMSPDTVQETSPFSVDEGYLDRVNTKHRLNGRIGLITVTPISRPDIKLHIQSIVLSLDSRMDYKS